MAARDHVLYIRLTAKEHALVQRAAEVNRAALKMQRAPYSVAGQVRAAALRWAEEQLRDADSEPTSPASLDGDAR